MPMLSCRVTFFGRIVTAGRRVTASEEEFSTSGQSGCRAVSTPPHEYRTEVCEFDVHSRPVWRRRFCASKPRAPFAPRHHRQMEFIVVPLSVTSPQHLADPTPANGISESGTQDSKPANSRNRTLAQKMQNEADKSFVYHKVLEKTNPNEPVTASRESRSPSRSPSPTGSPPSSRYSSTGRTGSAGTCRGTRSLHK